MRTFCFISQRGCPNLVPGREPLHGYREYPICNCVHSYSISPCQPPFFKNMNFGMITKRWMATELTKTVCTQGPGAHFRARVQSLDLVLGHRQRVRILAWVCLKKGCVDISSQRVQYSGTGSGYQVWRLPYLSSCNKGNRTQDVCQHAGYLFHWCRIPLLIKQNSFFCRHKKLSGILYP